MSQDKLPTSKIERASKFLKTGLKVGGNYVKHYGKNLVGKETDRSELEEANARDIFDGFSELRGSALKVAQMLSMENVMFSSAFTNVMQKAQYSVPPMSAPLAVQAFKKSINKSPEQVFETFDAQAHKAASMGQVHKATKDGKKFAVKIQYPGVADSIKSDLKMVKSVAHRVVNTAPSEMAPYFEEVEARLLEEADYRLELQNSLDFKTQCEHIEGIKFPNYYPEYSSDRVITMDWMDGLHLKEFIETNPSKEITQRAATNLWNLYEYQMHVLHRLNADPHPGNFLFQEDGSIVVLDFGCTKTLSQKLYDDYFILAEPGLFRNREKAIESLFKLEMLRPTDNEERIEHLLHLFERLIGLVARPYHAGKFNFNDPDFYAEMAEVNMEIAKLREMRGSKDFLFINRTYFGLYALFRDLDAQLDTVCQYKDFLEKEVV